ncbi:tyrosine-type recombinase/integrase [Acaricomes phytoseiuli]|uniref:tyrosine-type recombinase/integrase n=1 Tax=Acaricomes phytoseiuli TaxID=291968 RepID=UPI0003A0ADC4|nr:tyrosine-type recombinase/integrase [Acaricomes phytoseiuli]
MARVVDLWHTKDRKRTSRYGTGSRWQATWTAGGVVRKKSFKSKTAAEEYLTWVEHHRRSGTYISPESGRVLLGPLLDDWIQTLVHLRPSSLESVKSQVSTTLKPELGGEVLSAVTQPQLQSWLNELARGARTKELLRTFLYQFFAWTIAGKRIAENPAAGLKLPKTPTREKVYLTPEQLSHLTSVITPDYRDLTLFLALTGLRIGEAIELRIRDLEARHKRLTINRSAVFLPGGVQVGPPKSGKPRTIAVGAIVEEMLQRHTVGKSRDDLIFTSARGSRVDPRNFKRRHFDQAVLAADLPAGFRVHDLRHTAASWAIRSGASVLAVQRLLGHASPRITLEVYAELFDQDLDSVADHMDGLGREAANATKPPQDHGKMP